MANALKRKVLVTNKDRLALLEGESLLLTDKPAPFVSRITLNRPEIGNMMNNKLRAQIFEQLQLNDQDPDVRVTIIRGAGEDFCAGYEPQLSAADAQHLPFFTDDSDGQFQRNTLQGWFMMMDMAKPIIAQVHGQCLGAGNELATACDLVYVAEDARIGYPEIRNYGLPDLQMYPWLTGMRSALSIMLLAETMDGKTAVQRGWATGVFPKEELEKQVIAKAERVAKIPADLLAFNKRSVHRAFEAQGMRTNLRTATDLQALMWHSTSAQILRRADQKNFRTSSRKAGVGNQASSPTTPIETKRSKAAASTVQAAAPQPRTSAAPLSAPPQEKPKSPAAPISTSPSEKPKLQAPVKQQPQKGAPTQILNNQHSNVNPAAFAARTQPNSIVPTPVNSTSVRQVPKAQSKRINVHINKPLSLHIHNEDDEPQSKL